MSDGEASEWGLDREMLTDSACESRNRDDFRTEAFAGCQDVAE
jgi:hypothetical protein